MDLREAIEDVRNNGPWISTEGLNWNDDDYMETSGHIHFQNVQTSDSSIIGPGHYVYADLVIHQEGKDPVRLHRVSVQNLESMAQTIISDVRANQEEARLREGDQAQGDGERPVRPIGEELISSARQALLGVVREIHRGRRR